MQVPRTTAPLAPTTAQLLPKAATIQRPKVPFVLSKHATPFLAAVHTEKRVPPPVERSGFEVPKTRVSRDTSRDEVQLPFSISPALVVPPSATPAETISGSADARVVLASLAMRVLSSIRTSEDGREVHMCVRAGGGEDLEVRVRHEAGGLRATVVAPSGGREAAERMAALVERELAKRGVRVDVIEIA